MKILAPQVLAFWFGSGADYGIPQRRWFEKDAAFDAEVRRLFLAAYETLAQSGEWLDTAGGCLARIIVLDQFPRNMFRGSPRAFATDRLALAAARHAIASGYDRDWLRVEKIFAYLPFEHSEDLADQELSMKLFEGNPNAEWARKHWEIIRRFGRFPHRSAALGRESTPEERAWLDAGGGF